MQSVEELDAIQGELEKINDKVSAEILDIELRYVCVCVCIVRC